MESMPCTYRISIKAIIKNNEGKVLLSRQEDGSWELPGGGMEHGENPRQCLEREIAEETGLSVDWASDKPSGLWVFEKEVGSPNLKWFAMVTYEAKASGEFKPDLDTNDAALEIQYFSINEANKLKLRDNTRPLFLQ